MGRGDQSLFFYSVLHHVNITHYFGKETKAFTISEVEGRRTRYLKKTKIKVSN